jgi:hypothetical protein
MPPPWSIVITDTIELDAVGDRGALKKIFVDVANCELHTVDAFVVHAAGSQNALDFIRPFLAMA